MNDSEVQKEENGTRNVGCNLLNTISVSGSLVLPEGMFYTQPHVCGVLCLKGFLAEKATEHVLIFACLHVASVVVENSLKS